MASIKFSSNRKFVSVAAEIDALRSAPCPRNDDGGRYVRRSLGGKGGNRVPGLYNPDHNAGLHLHCPVRAAFGCVGNCGD